MRDPKKMKPGVFRKSKASMLSEVMGTPRSKVTATPLSARTEASHSSSTSSLDRLVHTPTLTTTGNIIFGIHGIYNYM